MKKTLTALSSLLFAAAAPAQWQSITYALKGGWNSIYLHGDASYAPPATLFANYAEILEVWRWNPNPTQVQFTTSPQIPSAGTPEWSVWKRDGSATSLSQMLGQSAYLVKCSGTAATTYSRALVQRALPPSATWVRSGANLLGFPSALSSSVYPTFSSYFATFPAATAANTKIYKYVGGDLSAVNPLQIFSPTTETLDRNQAYWFNSAVVGNFYAPMEIVPSLGAGLDFGRSATTITVQLRNRSAVGTTVTMTAVASAAAPSGQTAVTGLVPLTRRNSDGSETALGTAGSATSQFVGPNASVELSFGINRAAMTGATNAFYASLLRFVDSSNLYDISLPAAAIKSSLAGLWVGDALVGGVESKAAGSSGTGTAQTYALRYLIHLDDGGTARMLSQVYLGSQAAAPYSLGLCTRESGLYAADKASARRIVSAHLPLDRVLDGVADAVNPEPVGSGSFALGASLVRTISVSFNDPTSPFVHQYHPDHDNKSSSATLVSGQESYDLTRAISFNFSATPPSGVSATGYGTSVVAGSYGEVITGLRKDNVVVTGTFTLRRVSELGTLNLTP